MRIREEEELSVVMLDNNCSRTGIGKLPTKGHNRPVEPFNLAY